MKWNWRWCQGESYAKRTARKYSIMKKLQSFELDLAKVNFWVNAVDFHSRYYPRVSQILNLAQILIRQILFLGCKSIIRVWYFSKKIESSRFQMFFIDLHVFSRMLVPSFKPCIASLLSQWFRWLKMTPLTQKPTFCEIKFKWL